MIAENVIRDVKDRIDAEAVFGRHVALRKSGAGLVGTCPFHEDRSPSFRVYPEQARFHCFGCGARGDVFAFLQRLAGKDFPTVVRELAAEIGVSVALAGAPDPLDRDRADILEACEVAQRQFETTLWSAGGEPGRAYLRRRGISEQTARAFRLGFATGDLALAGGGECSSRGLALAGLIAPDGARRFRDRVTIPLPGAGGRVAGFTARTVVARRSFQLKLMMLVRKKR